MNTNTIYCQTEEQAKHKSILKAFLNWILKLRILGAEEMSKIK
ncbi:MULTISPECIES: hypothetical protein [Croceitalea]|uniref:Uncharacterized protein n=1 Tax=Croceitalea vernalis TaxID=3075599 RepID=A0ABU3BDL3_9FLAO|nr:MULTISPECIES: hypothetical protein [unclassified Croceitalea]MDT0538477.1 hypothetical protein [Croceitalea sp. P059]MDT0620255.1 hypothetical protein [Croceitalea sp. P007]